MSRTRQESSSALPEKEPWLAVNLSMFFPGIGQIYAGNVLRGWIFIICELFLYCLGGWLFISSTGDTRISFIVLLAAILINIWNLFDAHRCAKKKNSPSFEDVRQSGKDPWLAVFLTRILLGLGHVYGGRIFIGVFLLTIAILSFVFPSTIVGSFIGLLNIIILPFVVYHAYISTRANRELSRRFIKIFSILVIVIPLLISVPTAFFIREFIAEARYIPSGAMLPTLQINDRLVIDKLSYHFQTPKRKDIVVFSPTETLKQQNFNDAFIKRVIGLPEEKVEVKDGKVYINNQPLEENYIAEAPQYKYEPVTVPSGSYFMLGDNRNNSYDSHYWGFVPRENIIGKATKRYWPLNRSGDLK
ncbi:signal peptidase I [Coleofasciculus sp. FACHB-1120]|uniref:signal peptidase I n=1 Tax=Coleofasciculus sp. FACHB-1120 TaxID=2692783 RepID=UPI0016888E4D|nr:signal peptidase I [Coleofasciculus sp. FACHB-1120]MBD2742826.1 signal peptidase I [Coleofasciculus sp. FACHB-1120]